MCIYFIVTQNKFQIFLILNFEFELKYNLVRNPYYWKVLSEVNAPASLFSLSVSRQYILWGSTLE